VPSLEHDEKTILVETARHKDTFGNLFLTNKRLIFEHASGLFSKRVYVTLDLLLEGISDTSIEGTFQKKFVVHAKKGFVSSFPVNLEFLVKNPRQWQNNIMSALKAKLESIEADKRRGRVQIVLDFSSLKEYMEKGGLTLQKMKCPECGAPIKLPQSGNQITCEHCGSIILAQDIFEKIKKLI
jgi:DNA-directed RNA polymerase subunit RPC12/RpoP